MLLFPGWFKPGEMRGIETTGLSLLMLFAQIFFLASTLVPPALGFGAVFFGLPSFVPAPIAALLGGVVATALLATEAWFGTLLLGQVLDRFDPSREL
jgi:hypothetical protein